MKSLIEAINTYKSAKANFMAYSKFVESQIKPLNLRGNVRHSVITALEEGKARTGGTQGSGRWSKSYRNGHAVVEALKKIGVPAAVYNDAPRGGADGEYVLAQLTGDFSRMPKHNYYVASQMLDHEFKALRHSIEKDINEYFQSNKELWELIAPFFGGKIKNFVKS